MPIRVATCVIWRFRLEHEEADVAPERFLIAGPTASGKSALALELARKIGATIVNADSMQVYRDLHVLTARPSTEEERQAPHRLFGTVDGAMNFSVGAWLRAVAPMMDAPEPLIFVGGTGLYFKALTQGLSDLPTVPAEVRAAVRTEAAGRSPQELHADLALRDPATAQKLRPSDPQRVLRALEIFAATGQSLSSFQNVRRAPLLMPGMFRAAFLTIDRAVLRERIATRFAAMIERGAIEEVRALDKRALDPMLPVMRAHGVPGLLDFLRGDCARDNAIARGIRDTQQYARRQMTFARHQLPAFVHLPASDVIAHLCARG